MNAIVSLIVPLANTLAEIITSSQSAIRLFATSGDVPTWTEYMMGCSK